jgi:hypothetical protein
MAREARSLAHELKTKGSEFSAFPVWQVGAAFLQTLAVVGRGQLL